MEPLRTQLGTLQTLCKHGGNEFGAINNLNTGVTVYFVQIHDLASFFSNHFKVNGVFFPPNFYIGVSCANKSSEKEYFMSFHAMVSFFGVEDLFLVFLCFMSCVVSLLYEFLLFFHFLLFCLSCFSLPPSVRCLPPAIACSVLMSFPLCLIASPVSHCVPCPT